jgi:hypothetical protein
MNHSWEGSRPRPAAAGSCSKPSILETEDHSMPNCLHRLHGARGRAPSRLRNLRILIPFVLRFYG